ncbi:unnamed protein product [Alopecurus aequalis]
MNIPIRFFDWNSRGFGQEGRRKHLSEYIRREDVDIVGIQETLRQDFSIEELQGLSPHKFVWQWLPTAGHSGGILLGTKEETFEVDDMDRGEFFVSMLLTQRRTSLQWEVIVVYGPADHSRSPAFLAEVRAKVEWCTTPLVIAGDFNLIRSPDDKSSANLDVHRMRMFNDCIADLALREIRRVGARYTWTNNRVDPIRSVLDRVFVSVDWEVAFPLCSLRALTRVGSDHTPLLLSAGGACPPRSNRFHFENFWLEQPRFMEMVCLKWADAVAHPPRLYNAVDAWHHCAQMARRFMRCRGLTAGLCCDSGSLSY